MATLRVFVWDVSKAKLFYCEVFGFESVEDWGPAMSIVRHEDLNLWLSGPNTSAAKTWAVGTVPKPEIGFTRMVLSLALHDELKANLEQFGGRVVNGPISGPGGTQTIVADPDGNSIELFS